MGLLGMQICSNLKDIKKFKQKYILFIPIKKNNDVLYIINGKIFYINTI